MDRPWRPSYVALARTGGLAERARLLEEMLTDCTVCPRECRVDRHTELGECATGAEAVVASWAPHHGEERVISGRGGSGTVFLANCNLDCAFCQNWDISHRPRDPRHRRMSAEELAAVFLELEDAGCHNLNWVSPSHQVPQLVRALAVAADRGLTLPVVYNSNGYDAVDVLRLLDGVVDVWMPDLKYADAAVGERLSGVPDYPAVARAALTEMYRQVGDEWRRGPSGELLRGLLVRVLVLPENRAGVGDSLRWIAGALSPRVAVSLLAQYRPAHRVRLGGYPEIERPLVAAEWRAAVAALRDAMTGDRHQVQ